jgi:hypothetical protein
MKKPATKRSHVVSVSMTGTLGAVKPRFAPFRRHARRQPGMTVSVTKVSRPKRRADGFKNVARIYSKILMATQHNTALGGIKA